MFSADESTREYVVCLLSVFNKRQQRVRVNSRIESEMRDQCTVCLKKKRGGYVVAIILFALYKCI